jgi:hypothetical protein
MVLKEWRCETHGDFEDSLPLCPRCKRIAKRVFLTPPNIGSVKQQNITRALDHILPSQNLANYSNATGYPKPTFDGVYQNSSGMVAGFGLQNLPRLLPSVPRDAPLGRVDPLTGRREEVNLAAWADKLPKAVSAVNGEKIGQAGYLRDKRTFIEPVGPEKGRYTG